MYRIIVTLIALMLGMAGHAQKTPVEIQKTEKTEISSKTIEKGKKPPGGIQRQRLSQVSHAELKKELDAGRTLAVESRLKFTFDGKYDINSNVYLIYNIYDKNKSIVGSSNSAGLTVGGAQALSYTYDDNRYLMDLSGLNLSQNEFYTLEVIDTKGTKKYLKFIFKY